MAKNICAAFGKERIKGLDKKPELNFVPFENAIYCKHCRVEKKNGIYEVLCNKKYLSVDEDKIADSGECPDTLNEKIEQIASLLVNGLHMEGEKIFTNNEIELAVPLGVTVNMHSPAYLKYFLPAIGEMTAATECWDYEACEQKKLVNEDGIVKILFRQNVRDNLFEVTPNAESIDEMYKVLEGEL